MQFALLSSSTSATKCRMVKLHCTGYFNREMLLTVNGLIGHFATLTEPFQRVLRNNAFFRVGEDAKKSLRPMIQTLKTAVLSHLPDSKTQYILTTDPGDIALAAAPQT
eukprot:Blabericola_migrator_1__2986@NODE_1864_length_3632_cov_6_652735_g1193_i0_p2_GENE_NODE_1864_length_3632_cov_6_652735_g1193_i0NODE_1864_length_3632_cov_6_652735_g1193_i0_p2_ORF_typecomplete_len108_score11_90RT_RNaseH_2/PF17919_1/0_047_NODE_1864_length_3632_cov_6_652735_g1193_i08241147